MSEANRSHDYGTQDISHSINGVVARGFEVVNIEIRIVLVIATAISATNDELLAKILGQWSGDKPRARKSSLHDLRNHPVHADVVEGEDKRPEHSVVAKVVGSLHHDTKQVRSY